MKKALLVIVLIIVAVHGGYAMIETLSLDKLVDASEVIVLAEVKTIGETRVTEEGIGIVKTLLTVKKHLLGALQPDNQITVQTYSLVTDSIELVEGRSYVLFLELHNNAWEIVNSPQGVWEISEDGSFAGMGHGISLEQLVEAIAKLD